MSIRCGCCPLSSPHLPGTDLISRDRPVPLSVRRHLPVPCVCGQVLNRPTHPAIIPYRLFVPGPAQPIRATIDGRICRIRLGRDSRRPARQMDDAAALCDSSRETSVNNKRCSGVRPSLRPAYSPGSSSCICPAEVPHAACHYPLFTSRSGRPVGTADREPSMMRQADPWSQCGSLQYSGTVPVPATLSPLALAAETRPAGPAAAATARTGRICRDLQPAGVIDPHFKLA